VLHPERRDVQVPAVHARERRVGADEPLLVDAERVDTVGVEGDGQAIDVALDLGISEK
jgi:hypothetical protein